MSRKNKKRTRGYKMGDIEREFRERLNRERRSQPKQAPTPASQKSAPKLTKKQRMEAQLIHAMDAADAHGFTALQLCKHPAHYRFTAPDSRQRVDFWPATGRYWIVGSHGKAIDGDIGQVMQILAGDPVAPEDAADQQLVAEHPWLRHHDVPLIGATDDSGAASR